MPFQVLNLEEATDYLHLPRAELEKLVKDQLIPFEKHGSRLVFRKQQLEDWASRRILELPGPGLTAYHRQSTQGVRALLPDEAILSVLMRPEFIAPALTAKTKASVLRDMVDLANSTGFLNNTSEFLASLKAREELCSTGIAGGVAMLHGREPHPYLFESSFIVLGRTLQEIPFGAPDGQASDLFFLVCCQEARIHLHALARLCLVAVKTDLTARLRADTDAKAMHDSLLACEALVLANKRPATP